MSEKRDEVKELEDRISGLSEDYKALREGKYVRRDGNKTELFSVYEWESTRISDSSKHGHLVAICYDRREALAVRDGLRRINENPLIEYTAVSYGAFGEYYHSV